MEFSLQISNRLLNRHLRINLVCDNYLYSLLSITLALNLLAAGAKGETLRQLLDVVFGCRTVDEAVESSAMEFMKRHGEESGNGGNDKPVVCLSTGAWISDAFELDPSYVGFVESVFGADIVAVDFSKAKQVEEQINQWVARATKRLITEIPTNPNPATTFILANALYFKGTWANGFKKSSTQDKEFHLLTEEATMRAGPASMYSRYCSSS
ncbi:hypothetical protein Droror1_Dr00009477 [Drosera rotundifolia]